MAVLSGLLVSMVILFLGMQLALWAFPLGPTDTVESAERDILNTTNFLWAYSYAMVPISALGVGAVAGLLCRRRGGLASTVAFVPTVALFVAVNRGNTWSLMMAGMYMALTWLTAEAMRNRRDQAANQSPDFDRPAEI